MDLKAAIDSVVEINVLKILKLLIFNMIMRGFTLFSGLCGWGNNVSESAPDIPEVMGVLQSSRLWDSKTAETVGLSAGGQNDPK